MPESPAQDLAGLEALVEYIKRTRRFDLTGYKRATLSRRIEKRMADTGCASFTDYQDYLEVHPEEFVRFFDTILINVTSFFRDASAWRYLADEALPMVLTGKGSDEPIRVWSAGCATGEEAYTLAMVLADVLGDDQFRQRVKIYGTDVDEDALVAARQASFSPKAIADVPRGMLERFFEDSTGSFVFRPDLRRSVIFGRHDLIQDAPISHLDLLVCRNTLMYFNAEAQSHVLDRFHFALNGSGILFLGNAETLLTQSRRFKPIEAKLRIFSAVRPESFRRAGADPGAAPEQTAVADSDALSELAFFDAPVAQVVVSASGRVTSINQSARALFGLGESQVGLPIQDLELSYRPVELRSLVERAYAQRATVEHRGAEWGGAGETVRVLDVSVTPLLGPTGAVQGVAITFTDVTRFRRLQDELQHANRDLENAYEELQSTNEELETTNEELQSTVEELETTNEELQSTNEELETTNEELQSTNDELHSVNDELEARSAELDLVNGYLESILTGLHRGVIVLDRDLMVRVWNRWSEDLWGLRAEEAEGRNVASLEIGLPLGTVLGTVQSLLDGTEPEVQTTVAARNRRGRDFRCRVVATPLTADHETPSGVILLMEEAESERA